MLRIGDLARRAGVSVRTLRYYDERGLLRPERVDPGTGYRWYGASQIARVDEVAARLRAIERGLTVTNSTLDFKPLPPLRLAQLSAEVNDAVEIPAAAQELYETLTARLAAAGHPIEGRGVRTYYGRPDGSKIDVAVGFALDATAGTIDGLELVELAGEEPAAAVVFRGPPHEIADAWYTFEVALEERGLESYGLNRQLFIDAPDGSARWVVELQCPVRERGSACVG